MKDFIKAKVKFNVYSTPNGRKTPIKSGYQPLVKATRGYTSIAMKFDEEEPIEPGGKRIVEAYFFNKPYIKPLIYKGATLEVYEATTPIGALIILKVLSPEI